MMDFLLSSQPLAVRFFVAFLVVLVLIGVTAWLVRRLGSSRLGGSGRGRQPRLAVIDAASIDGRRRLVLIRRDNTEHLLMIGGPTDVVIEPNIVRAGLGRDLATRMNGAEPVARAVLPLETAWPLQPTSEPLPVAPSPRALRSSATDEPWLPPEPGARPRSVDGLFPAEAPKRGAGEIGAVPRVEPVAPEPGLTGEVDHNLAEMAQQLEAALRRTPAPEGHPPVTDALAVPPKTADILRTPLRDFKAGAEAKLDTRLDPKFESEPKTDATTDARLEPKLEPKVPKLEPMAEPVPKTVYDNLEAEMASLLGRSSGKS